MAYIVDLTLVLDQLFLVVLSVRPARSLTVADINMAFENYTNSNKGAVHREIRHYVRQATMTQLLQPTTAEEKVTELILYTAWNTTPSKAQRMIAFMSVIVGRYTTVSLRSGALCESH
jgi:hypothetical protein